MGPIEQGENCLLIAPTGSGKTEAAILPVLNRIVKSRSSEGISALYITPLRALNRDLVKRLEWLGRELGVRIEVRHGDTPASQRRKQVLVPPQLLITTPETVQNLFLSRGLRSSLKNLRFVMVDELHELYYNKRGAQLSVALERLEEISMGFQRIGISATIGDAQEAANFLFAGRKHGIIQAPMQKNMDITIEMPVSPTADNKDFRLAFGLDAQAYARITRVAELIRDSRAAIVFANTRQAVESLGSKLIVLNRTESFGNVGIHHSSIDKEERIAIENSFKNGGIKALVATSSLELGIDVGSIDLVVQYGSPKQATRLVQRIGRGGHRHAQTSVGKVIVHSELDCIEAAAIVEYALAGGLERRSAERNALDVLANQICAMVMEYGRIEKDKLIGIISRSYIFSGLDARSFDGVLGLLVELRLVKTYSNMIEYAPRARKYFVGAISVIPDSMRFVVKDAIENRIISTLDEEFVYSHIEEGAVFITKGLPWKVVSVEEGTVFVERSDDISAAVPDWEGEDLPVSRHISAMVWRYLAKGLAPEKAKMDGGTLALATQFIDSNMKSMRIDDHTITIEELENAAIAYMPMGKLANEFLSRAISAIASSQAGGRVNAKATPYAIILDYSMVVRRPDTARVFGMLKNIDLDNRSFALDSELFRYKFVQAAKLFGVVDKGAEVTKGVVSRLISFYESSPIYDETVRDLYKNYFDIDTARKLVLGLRSGEIGIELASKTPSPLSKVILESLYRYGELLATPERQGVIEKLLDKYEGRGIRMLCTFCSRVFTQKVQLKDEHKIFCPSCKSPLVAKYKEPYERIVAKRASKKSMTVQDNKIYRDMMREASLVDAYGSRALVALSVYGIGIETAARLLKYVRSDYRMFFVDVIEAQKNFIKNRKFWNID
jgi:ATP-dependent Lhr-like helicase